MDNGKTIGPDGIPIEVWKCIGEQGIWLLSYLMRFEIEDVR